MTIRAAVPMSVTAENRMPSIENTFLRSFWNRPAIPSPNATSEENKKDQAQPDDYRSRRFIVHAAG